LDDEVDLLVHGISELVARVLLARHLEKKLDGMSAVRNGK
jgi:hypothetical protein